MLRSLLTAPSSGSCCSTASPGKSRVKHLSNAAPAIQTADLALGAMAALIPESMSLSSDVDISLSMDEPGDSREDASSTTTPATWVTSISHLAAAADSALEDLQLSDDPGLDQDADADTIKADESDEVIAALLPSDGEADIEPNREAELAMPQIIKAALCKLIWLVQKICGDVDSLAAASLKKTLSPATTLGSLSYEPLAENVAKLKDIVSSIEKINDETLLRKRYLSVQSAISHLTNLSHKIPQVFRGHVERYNRKGSDKERVKLIRVAALCIKSRVSASLDDVSTALQPLV